MEAIRDDRAALSRRVPWGGAAGDQDWIMGGYGDLSGATFAMEIRGTPGETGTPLVSLANAAAGAQGINATHDAAFKDPDTGTVIGATTIRPLITAATLTAIPAAADPSEPLTLYYDLLATIGGQRQVLFFGSFTLFPGVTL